MSNIKTFMDEWFPEKGWDDVKQFILDSGVEIVEQTNNKWLPGYTNISKSSKPHHTDEYIRNMEESMFVLHDVCHNIFTMNTSCDEEEYVKRQIYGELFVFYLTEYEIVKDIQKNNFYLHEDYFCRERDCFNLMNNVILSRPFYGYNNIIDWMWAVFIDDVDLRCTNGSFEWRALEKYRKMFKKDLENSRKNYNIIKELKIDDYCIVGKSSDNHIDFFEAVKNGTIKNIKRNFNLNLPNEWI